MTKKKLKHSKFKNTGILFELLARQITADIISNKTSHAMTLVQKFFRSGSALGKEKRLYDLILQESAKNSQRAESLIDLIIKSRKKISNKDLAEQKYGLIKEIKNLYPIEDFLSAPISNYKELASVYKLFEDATNEFDDVNPKEIYQAKNCLIEHITQSKKILNKPDETDKDALLEYYKNTDEDLRLLAFKLLVEKFNEKYSKLDTDQMILLKEYINNVSNTNSLKTHVNNEVDKVRKELGNISTRIKAPVTKIKINEIIAQLEKIKLGNSVKDSHVSTLLLSYELIKEIKTNILL